MIVNTVYSMCPDRSSNNNNNNYNKIFDLSADATFPIQVTLRFAQGLETAISQQQQGTVFFCN